MLAHKAKRWLEWATRQSLRPRHPFPCRPKELTLPCPLKEASPSQVLHGRHPSLCHRSGSANPSLVIAIGTLPAIISTRWKRYLSTCHPDRSRGTCCRGPFMEMFFSPHSNKAPCAGASSLHENYSTLPQPTETGVANSTAPVPATPTQSQPILQTKLEEPPA